MWRPCSDATVWCWCEQEEKFTLPAEVQEQLEAYAARFFVLKTPRKLLWRPDIGTVSLFLTVGDQTLDLTVSPVQATILMHFRVRPLSAFVHWQVHFPVPRDKASQHKFCSI